METNGDQFGHAIVKKPKPLICRSWSENYDDVEVPGTPKTPRTSTTPGRLNPSIRISKILI